MAPVTRSKSRLSNGAVHFESLKVLERKRIRRKLEGLASHLEVPDDELSTKAEDMQCSICSFVFYIPFSLLPCKHTYCKRCISEWMNRQLTCPLCRCEPTAFKNCSDLSKEIQLLGEGLSLSIKEELGFRTEDLTDELDESKTKIIMLEDGLTIEEFKLKISQRITANISELQAHASSAVAPDEANRGARNQSQPGQHRNISQYRTFPNHRSSEGSYHGRSRYRNYRGPFHSRNRNRQFGEPFVRYDFGSSGNASQNIAFRAAQQVQDLLLRSASFPLPTIPQAQVDIQGMLNYSSSSRDRWPGFENAGALSLAPGFLQFGQLNPVQVAGDIRLNGVTSIVSQPREVTPLSNYSLSLQVLANAGLHNTAATSILPQPNLANLLPNTAAAAHNPRETGIVHGAIPLNLANPLDQWPATQTNFLGPHLSFAANPFAPPNEMRNSNQFCSTSSPFSFAANDALAAAGDFRRSNAARPWPAASSMPTTRGYNQFLRPSFNNVSLSFPQPNNSVLFSVVDLSNTTNIIDGTQNLNQFNQMHF